MVKKVVRRRLTKSEKASIFHEINQCLHHAKYYADITRVWVEQAKKSLLVLKDDSLFVKKRKT